MTKPVNVDKEITIDNPPEHDWTKNDKEVKLANLKARKAAAMESASYDPTSHPDELYKHYEDEIREMLKTQIALCEEIGSPFLGNRLLRNILFNVYGTPKTPGSGDLAYDSRQIIDAEVRQGRLAKLGGEVDQQVFERAAETKRQRVFQHGCTEILGRVAKELKDELYPEARSRMRSGEVINLSPEEVEAHKMAEKHKLVGKNTGTTSPAEPAKTPEPKKADDPIAGMMQMLQLMQAMKNFNI
jgi:hypothetical protein